MPHQRRSGANFSGVEPRQHRVEAIRAPSKVARRHGLTPRQLFTWRRKARRPRRRPHTFTLIFGINSPSQSNCEACEGMHRNSTRAGD
ncbi:transposase [Bosea sp. BIWAKO-01]|uniref:transposase n=1 Tax=Bosea sp. BIWAKO-01 TaxID=506668 RepID=UPI00352A9818